MNPSKKSFLLEFRASNVASFRQEFVISFEPQLPTDHTIVREMEISSVSRVGSRKSKTLGMMPAIGIIGANASGKTNILKAMAQMKAIVMTSFRNDASGNLGRLAFISSSPSDLSRYRVIFVQNGIKYDYGFELDDQEIVEEWAYWYPNGVRSRIFDRFRAEVLLGPKFKKVLGNITKSFLRPNALLLSTSGLSSLDVSGLKDIYSWFEINFNVVNDGTLPMGAKHSVDLYENEQSRPLIHQLMKSADLGILDAQIQDTDLAEAEKVNKLYKSLIESGLVPEQRTSEPSQGPNFVAIRNVKFLHKLQDSSVLLENSQESNGTMVWWRMAGWIISSLNSGGVVLIDEMDASLHPLLLLEAIRLFQDPVTNPNFAQLVFTGHTFTILDSKLNHFNLRRDQIYIVEKNRQGESDVFPLSDRAKGKDEALLKRYLTGIYGGIPRSNFDEFEGVVH
jgi:AAA15 family ATPase/GTPase